MSKIINIALDGPSGSGKSTIAKRLSKKMGIVYVDTGALYRSIGLYIDKIGVEPTDCDAVAAHLDEIKLEMYFENGNQYIRLNGEVIEDLSLRTDRRSMYASAVSKHIPVRNFLLDTQRNIAKKNSVVMDGRDIGTVILPEAQVKVFMTASNECRAKRRYDELCAKGIECKYEEVLADMIKRDENDRNREVAPCVPATDAVILDTSDLTIDEVVAKIEEIISQKTNI